MFYWKSESLEEYRECILNALIHTEDCGKGQITDLIVDYGCDMTLLINEGNKSEYLFLKGGTILEPISRDNAEFNIVQTITKRQTEGV